MYNNSDHEYDVLMTLWETLTSDLSIRITNPAVIRQNTGIGNSIVHLFSACFYPVLAQIDQAKQKMFLIIKAKNPTSITQIFIF